MYKDAAHEHAVTVHLTLSDGAFGSPEERDSIHRMSGRLQEAIAIKAAGEFDGDEFGGGEGVLFMYGPDADALFDAIEPLFRDWNALKGGYAIKRYGPPGSRTEKINF